MKEETNDLEKVTVKMEVIGITTMLGSG